MSLYLLCYPPHPNLPYQFSLKILHLLQISRSVFPLYFSLHLYLPYTYFFSDICCLPTSLKHNGNYEVWINSLLYPSWHLEWIAEHSIYSHKLNSNVNWYCVTDSVDLNRGTSQFPLYTLKMYKISLVTKQIENTAGISWEGVRHARQPELFQPIPQK